MFRQPRSRRAPGRQPPLCGTTAVTSEYVVWGLAYAGVSSGELELVSTAAAKPLGASIAYVSSTPGKVVGVEPAREVDTVALPTGSTGPTVLVVPGGLGWQSIADQPHVLDWLRRVAQLSQGLVTISTGSLLLAATGLLDGMGATGHWLAQQDLAGLGVESLSERSVSANGGRWVTASGTQAASIAAAELAERILWGRGSLHKN